MTFKYCVLPHNWNSTVAGTVYSVQRAVMIIFISLCVAQKRVINRSLLVNISIMLCVFYSFESVCVEHTQQMRGRFFPGHSLSFTFTFTLSPLLPLIPPPASFQCSKGKSFDRWPQKNNSAYKCNLFLFSSSTNNTWTNRLLCYTQSLTICVGLINYDKMYWQVVELSHNPGTHTKANTIFQQLTKNNKTLEVLLKSNDILMI